MPNHLDLETSREFSMSYQRIDRREFIESAISAGVVAHMGSTTMLASRASAATGARRLPGAIGLRIAAADGSSFRPYCSQHSTQADATTWVQIDLGCARSIDAVRLYPMKNHLIAGDGFPARFRIDCAEEASLGSSSLFADFSIHDYPDPSDHVVEFHAKTRRARYIRVTATKLRLKKRPQLLQFAPEDVVANLQEILSFYWFSLAKIEVLSDNVDVAIGSPVTVDPVLGNLVDANQLTRSLRPQGEGLVTDNPANITSAAIWRPPKQLAFKPYSGVQLEGGLFGRAFQNNIEYLLETGSVDVLLTQFRRRAGLPERPLDRKPDAFWEDDLAGSSAGRFLMGAANTLNWLEHGELRRRVSAVVRGIAECRQPNGYIMAYPEDTFFESERGAYTRSWVTQGLIDAGNSGNVEAFQLLRGYYDWFNSMPRLPNALREANQGGQGMVANTGMYFTPVGKPEDIYVIQRYFQENYWLSDLRARRVEAIWQYPYDRPHVYLLTNAEAYLDLYFATGDKGYLDAVLGAWELYRDNWQQVGGSFSIIEVAQNTPKSYRLYEKLGETCGNAFWIKLNHRLHLLDPSQERYLSEIEKSIYNVILANQSGAAGIRYHTILVGKKEKPQRVNTCCEGQATQTLASLPQYIYSISHDGLQINLFSPSTITWRHAGQLMQITMECQFPESPEIKLRVITSAPNQAAIRIRVPSWATGAVSFAVNGEHVGIALPGSFVTLNRVWAENDMVTFSIPLAFRLTRYSGVDQIEGQERFGLEYGPLLMAAVGAAEKEIELLGATEPTDLLKRLRPARDAPLHFTVDLADNDITIVPYYEISNESFSCFPVIEAKALTI